MSFIRRTPGFAFVLLFVALIAFYVYLLGRGGFGLDEIIWIIVSGTVYFILVNLKYDDGTTSPPSQRPS